ncbi:MAG TPA: DUF5995 family protein, partial [Chitinophagaceae bacterium]|nr:DUF5995 family protein [Chitinophagaceae bacterium]
MMRPFYLLLVFLSLCFYCHAQIRDEEVVLLEKLDAVSHSKSPASHFAELYFRTTARIAQTFLYADEQAHTLMQRMETRFAALFFNAVEAYREGNPVPIEWKTYFSNEKFSELQYQLLGINAHINGDIWQAL